MPVYVPKYNILSCVNFRNKSCCKSCASAFFLCELVFLSSSHVNASKSGSVFFKCDVVVRHWKGPPFFLPLFLFMCLLYSVNSAQCPCLLGGGRGHVEARRPEGRREPCSLTRYGRGTGKLTLLTWERDQMSHGRWHTRVWHARSHHQAAVISGPAAQSDPINPVTAQISLLWMTHL